MPLTLRLYDTDGVEIAWIRADPYEWEITHPDPSFQDIKTSITGYKDGYLITDMSFSEEEDTIFTGTVRKMTRHDETPKDHLEWAQEDLIAADGVDSTTLIDE